MTGFIVDFSWLIKSSGKVPRRHPAVLSSYSKRAPYAIATRLAGRWFRRQSCPSFPRQAVFLQVHPDVLGHQGMNVTQGMPYLLGHLPVGGMALPARAQADEMVHL